MHRSETRSGRERRAWRHGWLTPLLSATIVSLYPIAGHAQNAQVPPEVPPRAAPPAQAGETVRTVSLQEAVQIAHQNHGNIAVAEESVEAARQRIRQARTGTLPQVTGSIGYQTQGTSSLGGLFGGSPTQGAGSGGVGRTVGNSSSSDRGIQPRIGISYNIFDSGLTRANVRQARAGLESNRANLEAVRNDLAYTVTSNYLAQLRAERLLELRREQERLSTIQLRSVEANIRAGRAAEADRALVLSDLRNRQVDRIAGENDVRVAANALRNSMGLNVGPSLRLVELRENEEPLLPVELLRSVAQRQRPEVVDAESRVRINEASVSIARIGRKPRLDTTFGFNLTPNNDFQRSDYSFAAAISLPLWDAGLSQAKELEAKTGVSSAVAQLEQIKRDVASEVQEAYLDLVNARERLEASRLAVQAAQVNLEATTARYQLGIAGTSVVDLITAQVQFATANNNAISSLYDVHLAQARLNRATGRN